MHDSTQGSVSFVVRVAIYILWEEKVTSLARGWSPPSLEKEGSKGRRVFVDFVVKKKLRDLNEDLLCTLLPGYALVHV